MAASGSSKGGNDGRSPGMRVFLAALKWGATFFTWAVIIFTLLAGWYYLDLPDVDEALEATRRPTVTLVSADGQVLAARGDLYGIPVNLRDLPAALPDAVMATEDRRFRDHIGIDPIGVLRATVANVRAGRIVQGGSTITQQVAKNLFLTPERSLKRKFQELMLAFWLEHRFSKDQILTIYLNRVYLGAGTYGVDAAARRYFAKPAARLSTYEAAMLAGLLKAPSRYNPAANAEAAHKRTRQVLANMVAAGYLTQSQARAAENNRKRRIAAGSRRIGRHFADWVLDQVPSFVSPGDRDVTVITTLDADLQRSAERRLARLIAGQGAKRGADQAALLVLGADGAVIAMVGGRDYAKSQFNRVTQAKRQPGSAFKPFVFTAGLEAGLTPKTVMEDAPVEIGGWKPKNYDGGYAGPLTLTQALANSVNTIAVKVARKAGAEKIVETARRFGITSDLEADLSLALGTGEVTLMELTTAYVPFANGGFAVWPYGIREIRDGSGGTLYKREGSGLGRAAHPGRIAAMNAMLARVITEGTGKRAKLARPAAGKTGTSQDFRDAWFIGYTSDRVAGVWFGNDAAKPTKGLTGGGLPALLWRDVMTESHRGLAVRALPAETTYEPGSRPEGAPPPAKTKGFFESLIEAFSGSD